MHLVSALVKAGILKVNKAPCSLVLRTSVPQQSGNADEIEPVSKHCYRAPLDDHNGRRLSR